MRKILIIEDDSRIRRYLQLELQHEGFLVDLANDGLDGLKKWSSNSYSLILLDLMMPSLSGEAVCKQIRERSDIPIIILSAKDKTLSKIGLLDLGADDYITKPFEIRELLARIRVVLRNKKDFIGDLILSYKGVVLNTQKKTVKRDNVNINLTKTEFKLLHYLIINRDIVLSREQILTNVWGYDYLGGEKIVDVYIQSLRKKLDLPKERLIQTVRGFGYTLKGDQL